MVLPVVLADTPVWIDHPRKGDAALAGPARQWTRDKRLASIAGRPHLR
ncbi:MAG: hypothetical protein IPH23_06865 [Gammaproteobacteria bacterium]|nr:hypothetical protein [Gammaproteobacteria bacterium]